MFMCCRNAIRYICAHIPQSSIAHCRKCIRLVHHLVGQSNLAVSMLASVVSSIVSIIQHCGMLSIMCVY